MAHLRQTLIHSSSQSVVDFLYDILPPGKQFGKGSLRSKLVARRCLLRAVGASGFDVYLRSMRAMDLVA